MWTTGWNTTLDQIVWQAEQAEEVGFHGLSFTDSQGFWLDCWVALAVAATRTSRISLGTSVTNSVTRHPMITASAAASLQEVSRGRFELGIGRGDSALAYLGYAPAPFDQFAEYVERVQAYLRGDELEFEPVRPPLRPLASLGYAQVPTSSKIRWLTGDSAAKVPLNIATSGPRLAAFAGRVANGVTLSVGADVGRLRTLMDAAKEAHATSDDSTAPFTVAAQLVIAVHPDISTARRLAAGGLALVGRWSVLESAGSASGLDESSASAFNDVRSSYDMTRHGETRTHHADTLPPDVIDRLAIAGPASYCVERLHELAALGLDRFIISYRMRGADPDDESIHQRSLLEEVLPHLL